MISSSDLEQLVSNLPNDLRNDIDMDEARQLTGEEEQVFRENIEYIIAVEQAGNKSVSAQLTHNPAPDAAVGFGAYFGLYVPIHEGLHALVSKACGGTVHGMMYDASGRIAVLSREPSIQAELATGLAPYFIMTPVGLYFIKQGIKENNSIKVMFGTANTIATFQGISPETTDFTRVAEILSNYVHYIPNGAIKVGLVAGILGLSYGLVKAADYAKSRNVRGPHLKR